MEQSGGAREDLQVRMVFSEGLVGTEATQTSSISREPGGFEGSPEGAHRTALLPPAEAAHHDEGRHDNAAGRDELRDARR